MHINTDTEPRRFEPEGACVITPDALSRRWAARVAPSRGADGFAKPYGLVDGVAVVSVDGPLMQRGAYWFDGYDAVTERVRAALAEPTARAVMLKINSPGGSAAGCFESVRAMRSMARASGKPIFAYADEQACSGGYALACAAGRIFLPPSGEVGSVGVLSAVVSMRRAYDEEGVDIRVVRSDAMKALGHPADPLSDEAIAAEQAAVDELAGQFRVLVAEARGLSVEAVTALQADTRMGASAVAAGLADRVCSFDEALREASATALATTIVSPLTSVTPSAQHSPKRDTMDEETKQKLAALEALQRELGVQSPDELVAAVSAQSRDAKRAKDLDAELAATKAAAERNERNALIEAAQRDGRLSKADMADDEYQKQLASFTRSQLEVHLSRLTPRATAAGGAKHAPSRAVNGSGGGLGGADKLVADVHGFNAAQREMMAKIRAEEAAGTKGTFEEDDEEN